MVDESPAATPRFLVLGAVDVGGAPGAERLLLQPKLLMLAVFLILNRRRGFQSRERVISAFWPDQADEKGRSSLRSALYTLRGILGVDLIQRRGDDLAVDPTLFSCDAHEFAQAVEGDQLARALELYRGPVMEGFVPETATLQHWLDEEREYHRAMAADAAWALAERYESQSADLTSAARWARRAARLARSDERRIRRVMSLLERAGDAAGAVAIYEEFARNLARELDLRPSDETQTLAAAIRQRRASG